MALFQFGNKQTPIETTSDSVTVAHESAPVDTPPSVQVVPRVITDASGLQAGFVKVDSALRVGSHIFLAGWTTIGVELSVQSGQPCETTIIRSPRPDVANHLELPNAEDLGFLLIVAQPVDESAELVLSWSAPDAPTPDHCPITTQAASLKEAAIHPQIGAHLHHLLLANMPAASELRHIAPWLPESTQPCLSAMGFIEGVLAIPACGQGIAVGWMVGDGNIVVWLEDENRSTWFLSEAYRFFRNDIQAAYSGAFASSALFPGFIMRLDGLRSGGKLKLKALTTDGVVLLSETSVGLPNGGTADVARWILGINSSAGDLAQRFDMIDTPLIEALLQQQQSIWPQLPTIKRELGSRPEAPRVSVIVPLYGRYDFVEHQLLEFSRDEWFKEHAELIYVVDDPSIAERFPRDIESWQRLSGMPLTWLWGSVNRGFSGANNLGASHAQGDFLLFLNSDVFPQRPGWIEPLLDVLMSNPSIGAVGPRLLFANGSIQHAGMEFMRLENIGVWVNHHPHMGLAPSFDPHKELALVPAVTGACLAVRRSDFERIGGWDTGYLIGDFEDSDLCLKLQAEGLSSAYLPSVELTHLERQSFSLLAGDDFRGMVTLFNAFRHQRRWDSLIARLMGDSTTRREQTAR